MKGTFGDRIKVLREAVGSGHLVGSCEVDQVYAHYQHEHPEFYHPDGGKAYYLRDPLFARVNDYLRHLAANAILPEGSDLALAMADNMENLSRGVYDEAPLEFADLKASGHPVVKNDQKISYDRAPLVHRLTEEELRIKNELRQLLDPHRYLR